MARNERHERRRAHRTRYLLDGLTAVEIAFVVLLEVMVKITPQIARRAVVSLDLILGKHGMDLTAGTRDNLVRLRDIVADNNKRGGIH